MTQLKIFVESINTISISISIQFSGPSLLEAMSVPHAVMTNATGINHVTSDTPVDLAHPHRGHEASLMSSGYPPVSLHPMPGFPTPSQVHFPGHGAPSDFLKPPPPR